MSEYVFFSDPTVDSILAVKNNSTEMMVTTSDQAVFIFVPVLAGVFLPVKLLFLQLSLYTVDVPR